MSRLVLDTNCLIQIVSPRSKYHFLWDSFVRGENTLCVSNEIIEEYVEIMQKLMGYAAAEYVVKTILNSKFTEMITPFYNFTKSETITSYMFAALSGIEEIILPLDIKTIEKRAFYDCPARVVQLKMVALKVATI